MKGENSEECSNGWVDNFENHSIYLHSFTQLTNSVSFYYISTDLHKWRIQYGPKTYKNPCKWEIANIHKLFLKGMLQMQTVS